MWPQSPGLFTRIMAATVAPRNASTDTRRSRFIVVGGILQAEQPVLQASVIRGQEFTRRGTLEHGSESGGRFHRMSDQRLHHVIELRGMGGGDDTEGFLRPAPALAFE